MRICTGLCVILCVLVALPALAEPPAGAFTVYRPYNALLQQTCPQKRLYYLSPADLNDLLVQDFPAILKPREKGRLMHANDERISCAKNIAGANCENRAMLRAIDRTHLMVRFVGMLCKKAPACRSQSNCG